MLRKTPSDPQPATIGSEIKKELRPYLALAGQRIRLQLDRHPKTWLFIMLCAIIISAVLAFTVMRITPTNLTSENLRVRKQKPGVPGIWQEAMAIKRLWELQQGIDSLSRKTILTRADSELIQSAQKAMVEIQLRYRTSYPSSTLKPPIP